ncbi:MAG TPA: NAD(P)H-hydrate epimerase [Candidatus Omnitrophica bacterium]|nr:NAD(P)H-hydrate epimerase [Candidatus Omnitrophota bacterium]
MLNPGYIGVIIYLIVKVVSVAEMREMDRMTIEDFGVPSLVLMENAGRHVSDAAAGMLSGTLGKKAAVFCGTGNNGGDGFVSARHLIRQGFDVTVYIVGETSSVKSDPLVNLNILRKMKADIKQLSAPVDTGEDLVIDAVFGIGLKGEVKGPVRDIIMNLNRGKAPILAVDAPSGLDSDTGKVLGASIKAIKTVTMQFPKKGFFINDGPAYTGEVIVADIGIMG